MPKDEWKRANDRVKYGPLPPKAETRRKAKERRKQRKKNKRAAAMKRLRAENGKTVVWFGKHKGLPLDVVPQGYLQWLADQRSKWGGPKVAALVKYLHEIGF